MNALRNKVQLIGRLGKDAETITFDDGKVKARFPVATNESFRNGEGERVERTQWHDVVAWGGLAEVAGQYLKKGAEVAVEGRLIYRTYEDGEAFGRVMTAWGRPIAGLPLFIPFGQDLERFYLFTHRGGRIFGSTPKNAPRS